VAEVPGKIDQSYLGPAVLALAAMQAMQQ